MPALRTVSGRLLVAQLPADEQAAFLENDADYRLMDKATRQKLEKDLQRICREGYFIAPSTYRTGLDIAVLIGSPATGMTASLAIPCLAGGLNEGQEGKVLKAMIRCAAEVHRSLGLDSPEGFHHGRLNLT